jgi:hypothetical protein
VSESRCPNCGGLVTADADWCGQCFAPLRPRAQSEAQPRPSEREEPDRPVTPTVPRPSEAAESPPPSTPAVPRPSEQASGPGGVSAIRVEGDRVVWRCPRCDTENPIEASACSSCGAPFGKLFEDQTQRPSVPAGRAVRLSLLFPGLGHAALGRGAEGLARGVAFAYAAATVVTILVMRAGSGLGPFLALFLLSAMAAAVFYGLAALDAGRAASGESPILSSRGLLYGASGLILLTVVVLVITGIRASRG